ncbi:hypothetical protein niasHT_008474 [Heterodera trifolii]|uniref:Uncharacterized protein n=1 Tax=Heterodera trifolii TaxID=157864 RepID=A0ABD2M8Q2_9BILA
MNAVQICILLALFFGTTFQQIPADPSSIDAKYGPLRIWRQDRFVRCIFCMNYDDYNNLSTYGCDRRRVGTCVGNICYMRQHKKPEYFLYTSGCVNLTWSDLVTIRAQISAQNDQGLLLLNNNKNSNNSNFSLSNNNNNNNETQLCEVGPSVNTCICADRDRCNNVTSVEPFVEYRDTIFGAINFDELAHFRHLLPNDPILNERDRSTGGGGYLLITNSMSSNKIAPPALQVLIIATIQFVIININYIINVIKYAF